MNISYERPTPKERTRNKRVTDQMAEIRPGGSIVCDPETAHAFCAFGRYHGWKMARRTEGESVIVWRVS